MATGSLSWRWRHLWTNVTLIHIDSNKFDYSRDIDSTFNNIITRITSPFIHSFSVELGNVRDLRLKVKYPKRNLNYSWLREICDRNLRELKVTNTELKAKNNGIYDSVIQSWFPLPSFICVTQSLVSIELDSMLKLQLPDQINLPNLKKLHLCSTSMNSESLEKLIKACPSLEELCFLYKACIHPSERKKRQSGSTRLCDIKFSHQKLQRLFIKKLPYKYRVVINAPNLEYLAIHASKSVAFRFEKEPVISCEAKIHLTDYDSALTEDEFMSMTKFYRLFRKVTILTPDVFVLENSWPSSNMFCNATQLTLSIYTSYIDILLAILELCPVLDVLTLQIRNSNGLERAAKTPGLISTLQRVLNKINIEIYCNANDKTTKSLVELVDYLLSNSVDLKHFHITVDSSCHRMEGTEGAQIWEMKLCKLLYQCPVLSEGCEVEFVGRFFKMSRKAGLKFLIANGKDSPIN
ncbi:F-box/FBD/LRR-repeat protein At5g22660-like [Silene latifolia]|uniref:F-box/FBD/LRR-repeat protein At5g22660-like n=1 Tax=Silene latifolia TaxID=37657 RepID=UPI003D785FA8